MFVEMAKETGDVWYSRLSARGQKHFRGTTIDLAEKFPEYAKLGLPAHKAALDGNVDALQVIFTSAADDGVRSRDSNGATPLHLAVRNNHVQAVR